MKTCTTLSDELHRNENASIRPGPFKRIQTMAVNVSIFFSQKEKSGVITREQTNLWVPLGVQEQDVRLIFA